MRGEDSQHEWQALRSSSLLFIAICQSCRNPCRLQAADASYFAVNLSFRNLFVLNISCSLDIHLFINQWNVQKGSWLQQEYQRDHLIWWWLQISFARVSTIPCSDTVCQWEREKKNYANALLAPSRFLLFKVYRPSAIISKTYLFEQEPFSWWPSL